MSTKHILLPLTGEKGGANAAVCSLALAKATGAHVTAGYEDELGPYYATPDMAAAATYGMFYEQMQQLRKERKAIARKHYDEAVNTMQIPIVSAATCDHASTMWIDTEAPIEVFGPLADLVVLESPGPQAAIVPWNAIEETLFHARRPALVIPKDTTAVKFSRVVVAWNGSHEAANALKHAIDLLPKDADVTILQVGDLRPGSLPAAKAIVYLGWHGIQARLHTVPDSPHRTSDIILQEAERMGAGCIIMGAYTHSRTRELLLGGVTDSFLRHATRPLFMAH